MSFGGLAETCVEVAVSILDCQPGIQARAYGEEKRGSHRRNDSEAKGRGFNFDNNVAHEEADRRADILFRAREVILEGRCSMRPATMNSPSPW